MEQPLFRRRVELAVKLVLLAVFLAAAVAFAVLAGVGNSYDAKGEPMAQPIPFSHKHHVGDVGLDCRFCHSTVEKTAFAGMPSTQVCLGCHSQLFAQAGILAALKNSAASGQPIAWQRVHFLPGFVYFDHSIHVSKGVACMECHGRIDQMPLTWQVHKLEMGWCIDCHRDPAPHLHPHDQVFAMPAEPLGDADTQLLARTLKLQGTQRLTDCSTCHR
ncbi:MAG: cytochrome c3 family protein [Pseudomonadota bacterium]